ncbi:hypothetical protein FNV43_RR14417 [Rhamnella rubrinervis]|uniref:Leucine-rich repeat-containing N-terminal plant-type domain-containing protein n=1 Tax=Rhamnella rubrinervis TaxID=2594499 RepID=A0A8K0MFP1_9ROSA|nr:hypothetical protein FNV43_RR14417 [Rhamnella rubrinervis]
MKGSAFCMSFCLWVGILLLSFGSCSEVAHEDDVKCLQGIKQAVKDPLRKLNSWDFGNTTVGYICKFVGVSCWNDWENRILNLELRDMKLSGTVPQALEYCYSLQILDLGGNEFSGTIPSQICTWLPFLVGLDLSNNDISGSIPTDLAKCAYLNNLELSDNSLSGNIPHQFSSLNRLKKFSVANNQLTGTIPPLSAQMENADFAGNKGLCGMPLGKCGGLSKKDLAIIIATWVCGAAASLLLTLGLWWWYRLRSSKSRKRVDGNGGDEHRAEK